MSYSPHRFALALVDQMPPAQAAATRLGAEVTWLLCARPCGSVGVAVIVENDSLTDFGDIAPGWAQDHRVQALRGACHCMGWGWCDLRQGNGDGL